jgi:uncharacterized protein GlcG (DUF336 family)
VALTLDEANRVVAGAVAHAKELNIRVSVAVCDAGGRLVAFNRMDGVGWSTAYSSQGKALAAAAYSRPTVELAARADSAVSRGVVAAEGSHMILSQGGVPILRNGQLDGSCGVGGGTAEQDEECARAGIALIG